jgi:endonuclease/exonuclease/phosphatase family metal-dependent hydrolase
VCGRYTVACSFKNVNDNIVWAFGGVYGQNDDGDRRELWDELVGLMSWWEMPWCFGGDFNVVRYPSEKSSISRFSPAMAELSEFIFEQALEDLPLVGGHFMWSNNQDEQTWSRIDKFLFSQDLEDLFPDVSQKQLPRLLSDHFPLLLDCGALR